jgi:hypothetical protein
VRVGIRTIANVCLAFALLGYALAFLSMSVGARVILGALLALTIVAFAALLGRGEALQRQPRRTRGAFVVLSALAIILVAATLLKGLDLLKLESPPRGESQTIGVVPPVPPRPGDGFALGLGVTVEGCDQPVQVTLVATGTAEYWQDNAAAIPRDASFKLGIPTSGLRGPVTFGTGSNISDVTEPIAATPHPKGIANPEQAPVEDMTVISGSIPDWARKLSPVVAKFDADWLTERGQGTCYLALPALTGNLTAFGSQEAAGHAKNSGQALANSLPRGGSSAQLPTFESDRNGLFTVLRPRDEIVHGNATVVVASGGNVLVDKSVPPPNTVERGDPTWSCGRPVGTSEAIGEAPGGSVPDILLGRGRGAIGSFSKSRLTRELGSNCGGYVAVEQGDAGERRDVTLLMVGIGIALGLGLFIELLMAWVRAEFPFTRHAERNVEHGS